MVGQRVCLQFVDRLQPTGHRERGTALWPSWYHRWPGPLYATAGRGGPVFQPLNGRQQAQSLRSSGDYDGVVCGVGAEAMKKHAHRARRKASTLHLLHRAGLSADELFSFFVGFDGPSARQHAILLAVARNGGASQAAIVQDTGIDRSTTSAMAVRLVKNGWLRRRPDRNDGRAYSSIPPAGKGTKSRPCPCRRSSTGAAGPPSGLAALSRGQVRTPRHRRPAASNRAAVPNPPFWRGQKSSRPSPASACRSGR